jgi:polysaccharide pyruvyl transferase WcaK-like protein
MKMNRAVKTKNVRFGQSVVVGIGIDHLAATSDEESDLVSMDDVFDKRGKLRARENESYELLHSKQQSIKQRSFHRDSILALQQDQFDNNITDPKGLMILSLTMSKDSVKKARLRGLQNELDATKSGSLRSLEKRKSEEDLRSSTHSTSSSSSTRSRRDRRRNPRSCESLLSSPFMAANCSPLLGKLLC